MTGNLRGLVLCQRQNAARFDKIACASSRVHKRVRMMFSKTGTNLAGNDMVKLTTLHRVHGRVGVAYIWPAHEWPAHEWPFGVP